MMTAKRDHLGMWTVIDSNTNRVYHAVFGRTLGWSFCNEKEKDIKPDGDLGKKIHRAIVRAAQSNLK